MTGFRKVGVACVVAGTLMSAGLSTACIVRTVATAGNTISWSDNLSGTVGRVGATFAFTCPPGGQPGNVWGTDIYSDDSSVCTAAVHAGVIGWNGGYVRLVIQPGQSGYYPSARNGVMSQSWGAWGRSFSFTP